MIGISPPRLPFPSSPDAFFDSDAAFSHQCRCFVVCAGAPGSFRTSGSLVARLLSTSRGPEVGEEMDATSSAHSLLRGSPAHHAMSRDLFGRRRRVFVNPWAAPPPLGLSAVLAWKWRNRGDPRALSSGWLSWDVSPSEAALRAALPEPRLDADKLGAPPAQGVQGTWVGHSTVLAQLGGLTMLTDPIFSERCSPLPGLGPKRLVPPALGASSKALDGLDVVVVSHAHYDHLDRRSVEALHARFGDRISWLVPLGLARWFAKRGIKNVIELDWWEEAVAVKREGDGSGVRRRWEVAKADPRGSPGAKKAGVRFVLTPAQHWSNRTGLDRNESLWGGWAAMSPSGSFWYAGDTGYCPAFEEIGDRLGPFDLAAIPIGAYDPRDIMRYQHINPDEAVRIHKDVKAHVSLSVHHATFVLTDEAVDHPSADLRRAMFEQGLDDREFVAPRHGTTVRSIRGEEREEHEFFLLEAARRARGASAETAMEDKSGQPAIIPADR